VVGGGTFTTEAERVVGKSDGGCGGWCGWEFGYLGREKGVGLGGSSSGNGGDGGGGGGGKCAEAEFVG